MGRAGLLDRDRKHPRPDTFTRATLDLLAAIRDDRPPAVPIEEGVRSLELALAATRSAEQGVPVTLEPA